MLSMEASTAKQRHWATGAFDILLGMTDVSRKLAFGSRTAVQQRLPSLVDTTSMRAHGHAAVIGPALIANAQ